jgi:hypothetical protein
VPSDQAVVVDGECLVNSRPSCTPIEHKGKYYHFFGANDIRSNELTSEDVAPRPVDNLIVW